ncbi:ABC transporter substrate-binding protein [Castellaniella sp.]|uniref:ABC transporter substrate-binding protein n=1 Tax=Castellaniella sp. TaxID=1955812 RepID=UPI002AFEB11A|nr:ABC transporter substrate-binding protein [Castellaniella sp.]
MNAYADDQVPDAQELRIGFIESITGPAASYGEEHTQGTQLAIEEINKAGGYNGHPVVALREDDKSDPASSITSAKKLITQKKVDAIVGSSASLVTIAFSKEDERYKVPLVNGMAGSPKVTEQGYKYTWRIKITDQQTDTKAVEYFIKHKGAKTIGFLVENSDYGKPPTKGAAERAKELGAQVVAYEEYNRGDIDFKAQLSKIREHQPDLLFIHGYYTEGSIIARQIHDLGIKSQVIVNEGQGLPKFAELAGKAANGVVFPTTWLVGLPDARSQQFEKAYEAKWGQKPGAFAAGSYEAVYTVLEAAKRGDGATRAQIQAGLSKLDGFDTLLGPIHFDVKNQNDGEVRLAHFKEDKIEPLPL